MLVWWPEAAPKGSCLAEKAVAIGLFTDFCSQIPANLAASCGGERSECLIQDEGRRMDVELPLEAGTGRLETSSKRSHGDLLPLSFFSEQFLSKICLTTVWPFGFLGSL